MFVAHNKWKEGCLLRTMEAGLGAPLPLPLPLPLEEFVGDRSVPLPTEAAPLNPLMLGKDVVTRASHSRCYGSSLVRARTRSGKRPRAGGDATRCGRRGVKVELCTGDEPLPTCSCCCAKKSVFGALSLLRPLRGRTPVGYRGCTPAAALSLPPPMGERCV
jgi:hypothetical protein